MNFFKHFKITSNEQLERRLLVTVAIFLFLYGIALSLSPAVRLHTWNTSLRLSHWVGFLTWLIGIGILYIQVNKHLPDHDPLILPIVALLAGWGLMTIFRLDSDFGFRQTIWLGLSLLVVWICIRLTGLLSAMRRFKYVILTAGLILTALTLLTGLTKQDGTPLLWLGISGNYIQPSEILKLLLIIYLSAYLADRMPVIKGLLPLLLPTLIVSGLALLILVAQRDLGTAVLFIMIYTGLTFLATGRRRILWFAGGSLLVAGLVGYQLFDVIRLRVDSWINPWLDPSGRSYQIVQSLISVAAGGIFGRGIGLGNPALVPVAQSDFIATAITEEMGLAGLIVLLIAIALLVIRGLIISLNASNQYYRNLAGGLSIYLGAQSILIIAGNLRLLPLTGVTLPFISYGGSSLLTTFIAAAILLLISNQTRERPAAVHSPRAFQWIGGGLLAGFLVISLGAGYWSVIRSADLQTRNDNPRRSISDQFIMRGSLLDQHNQPIDITDGEAGNYQRIYLYPPLSATLGYNNPSYGQAGLEASLDGYLRGLQGYPASTIFWNQLLYSQPPAGLDVRLSIDMGYQQISDSLLEGHNGALVLLNASTGEVLAISSHPNFDPNQLNMEWAALSSHPNSPLLNRATQAGYYPGTAFGPFILAGLLNQKHLPLIPQSFSTHYKEFFYYCPNIPEGPITWGSLVAAGCPGSLVALANKYTASQYNHLLEEFGFFTTPEIPLQQASASSSQPYESAAAVVLSSSQIKVTPLQMAVAAASLSNDGKLVTPKLVVAVKNPDQGWIMLPTTEAKSVGLQSLKSTAEQLASQDFPGWQSLGISHTDQGYLTWFLGGTLPDWKGTPLAMALVLEENNPTLAKQIGQSILESVENH